MPSFQISNGDLILRLNALGNWLSSLWREKLINESDCKFTVIRSFVNVCWNEPVYGKLV